MWAFGPATTAGDGSVRTEPVSNLPPRTPILQTDRGLLQDPARARTTLPRARFLSRRQTNPAQRYLLVRGRVSSQTPAGEAPDGLCRYAAAPRAPLCCPAESASVVSAPSRLHPILPTMDQHGPGRGKFWRPYPMGRLSCDAKASVDYTVSGQKVAFLVDETAAHQDTCCRDNVFVAQGDGSGVARVTDLRELFYYDFSATGETVSYEQGVTSHLFVIKADGTGVQPIAPPGICCPQLPSLSPDGTKVAYFAYPEAQEDGAPGYEIYVSPVDESAPPIDVSQNPGDDWSPVWSPDGSRIAFVSSAPGASFNPGSLQVMNADGTGQMNLTPVDNVWQPAWSPDGTRIAYSGSRSGTAHIYVANADGSGRTDITPDSDSSLPTWTGR
jgi:WD40 repeat protein